MKPDSFMRCAVMGFLYLPGLALAYCEQPVARLVVIQGEVESMRASHDVWRKAASGEALCSGDRLRTLELSRATLRLSDETYVSLDQRTTIVLSGLRPKMPTWLDLIKGVIYLRSRTPTSLDIKTTFINAAIRGTEFLVASSDTEGQVTTFEGRVEASNTLGTVLLSDGQTAVARAGQAPLRKLLIAPDDAVQWALHYPPLIDLADLRRASADPAVKRAAEHYLAGDSLGALRELEGGEQAHALWRAALLLGLGRVDEAVPLIALIPKADAGQALALRSVIALARNRKAEALQLAEQSTQTQPRSPVPWIALSYARQARFELEAALDAAQKAAELAPDNGLAQTRLAELLDSLGRRDEARAAAQRAVRLNPGLGRGWTLLGFTQLMAMDRDTAQASFENALRRDAADPLAHFGLGLAKIREGDLEQGTAELEIAASLDPNDSLTRSYLGKVYYERKRSKVAQAEYRQAKRFDPNDPTPWFYDAIKKHSENRPVEAVQDLQKAIALNDNRAVYRSRQLLDSDLAARGAALGRIYREGGFEPRGRVESWRALASEPGSHSSHRLLSDSYALTPRHEIAKQSELLQSQLLQPLNITPVQPQLTDSPLIFLGGLGPSSPSLNEFNPLFERDRFSLLASGLVASHGTYSDEVVHSGNWRRLSYSVGQMHYETQGFRKNNDLRLDTYNAFLQYEVAPGFSVQAEYQHKESLFGDLNAYFYPDDADLSMRQRWESNSYRAGFHYKLNDTSTWLGNLAYEELTDTSESPSIRDYHHLYETEFLHQDRYFNLMAGGGHYGLSAGEGENHSHDNGHLYLQPKPWPGQTWTLGLSGDFIHSAVIGDINAVNPKFGLLWDVSEDTTLRFAAFGTTRRDLVGNRTLEPTQVAGFNQFFDDGSGTRSFRYGLGLDHRFDGTRHGGLELSYRQLKTPFDAAFGETKSFRANELLYKAYFNQALGDRWSASLEFYREHYDSHESILGKDTDTLLVPFGLSYFDPAGPFLRTAVSYLSQTINVPTGDDTSDGFLLDLAAGYRFPRRLGILELGVQNILDTRVDYEGFHQRSPPLLFSLPKNLPFAPERTLFMRVTFSF